MVSVVIPNWNGRRLLGEGFADCLDAVLAQSYKKFELIVVDNGSTDDSVEFIKQNYPSVRLVELPVNTGFTGGVNAGIRAAKGEYVALLNDDAVADKDWLKELVAAMETADIAAAKILHYDDRTKLDSSGDHLSKWGIPYPRDRGKKDTYTGREPLEIFAASGGASMYKRSVFERIGTFDDLFFAYLEDVDLSFRARMTGFRVVLAPGAKVYHHIGKTSGTMGHFGRYHFIKNSNYMFYKDFPLPLLLKTLPRFWFIQVLLFAAAAKRGALLPALKAHAVFWLHLPKILAARRGVQRQRIVSSRTVEGWLTDHWPLKTRLFGRTLKK